MKIKLECYFKSRVTYWDPIWELGVCLMPAREVTITGHLPWEAQLEVEMGSYTFRELFINILWFVVRIKMYRNFRPARVSDIPTS